MRALFFKTAAVALLIVTQAAAATSYTYDTLGRLWTATYDNGKQIVYTYDPAGNRTQVVTQATPPHALNLKKVGKSKRPAPEKKVKPPGR